MLCSPVKFSKDVLSREPVHHTPMDLTLLHSLDQPVSSDLQTWKGENSKDWSYTTFQKQVIKHKWVILTSLLVQGGINVNLNKMEKRHDHPTALIHFSKCWIITSCTISYPMHLAPDKCPIMLAQLWTHFGPPEDCAHVPGGSRFKGGSTNESFFIGEQSILFLNMGKPTLGCRHTLS